MSQISEVNEQILSKILKTDEFYEALWGKEDFTPNSVITVPNDYNCGAITNSLEYVYAFIREITGMSLNELPEPYIDIVIFFFTGLIRFSGEVNIDFIRRMESLIIRESSWRSKRFGTPWDILNVFSYYIDRSLLYYIPNSVITDLMINGDFESPVSTEWTFSPSGDRSIGDSFTGGYKVDFTDFTDLSQTIAVTSGVFILNSYLKPISGPPVGFASSWDPAETTFENASYADQDYMFSSSGGVLPTTELDVFNLIVQRDSDGYFYNTTTFEWTVASPTNTYKAIGGEYKLSEFFIVVDGSYNITIKYSKTVDFYLDYIKFGEKLYPAFELLLIDSGPADGFASSWDPAETTFENASYIDQDFMFASATSIYSDIYYQELLDMIKASGVKGIFTREVRI
jgi:hypothetical protein